jgi:hypothetical protein
MALNKVIGVLIINVAEALIILGLAFALAGWSKTCCILVSLLIRIPYKNTKWALHHLVENYLTDRHLANGNGQQILLTRLLTDQQSFGDIWPTDICPIDI